MKGTVTWFCASCNDSDTHRMNIRILAHDPGSYLVSFWSWFIPAKRRVKINTICARCLEETQLLSQEEQEIFIQKKKDQIMYKKSVAWRKQEWELWVTFLECQGINDSANELNEMIIHLMGGFLI